MKSVAARTLAVGASTAFVAVTIAGSPAIATQDGTPVAWQGATANPDGWETAAAARILDTNRPGAVTNMRVLGLPMSAWRPVRWSAPAAGATPSRYMVQVRQAPSKQLVWFRVIKNIPKSVLVPRNQVLAQTRRPRGDIIRGSFLYQVSVYAGTATSWGPATSRPMRISY